MHERHWHILGAGAIGSLFACLFQDAGIRCSLLLREGHAAPHNGTRQIRLHEGEHSRAHIVEAGPAAGPEPIHYLLVCTKAYDLLAALTSVQPRLAKGAVVLLLANGLGYQQRISEQWPQLTVFSGSTTEGAFREGGDRVRRAGRGTTWLGSRCLMRPPAWFSDWQALDADCRWAANIDTILWRKFAINCAINPLTALHRCRNGLLADDSTLTDQVQNLCLEIAAVGEAAGQHEAVSNLYPSVMEVVAATAHNRSSMLQDVLAGRRTEIDYLTAFLVATADRLGLAVPHNSAVLADLRTASTAMPQPD